MDTTTRRYDLDWLRIIAFGLLIFYHIGMFYVTWDWHVKSDHAGTAIEPLMLLVNPWRLELLFFISGVAARFMVDKTTPLRFADSRFNRLFWPLLFGMLVIVPPQSYYEIVSDLHFSGGYLDFYGKYLTAHKGWCDHNGCLIVPTWNHLWYVAYLLAYCLIFACVWPLLKRLPMQWARALPAPVYFLVPFALFWAAKVFLMPLFEETHAFVGDWYVHANSFGFFILGVMVARFDRFFEIARKARFLSLFMALIAYGILVLAYFGLIGGTLSERMGHILGAGLKSQQAIFAIMALLGFARQHLAAADGPIRRTLTEAIFPFYIIHQTIIVVAAYNLNRLHLPVALEATLLVILTIGGCGLTYLIVRRIPILRPVFGLPLRAKPAA
ncbi:acyltransferase family protein [Asticcacaulis sp.]|uniref:acyltransferase family protein n=1 Tax=Asticcacaulis sp. TaxID=1872648 RepID=UPI002BED326F|nr:acyltransferase family protein [Asticcacaulis sp.]HTM81261.1 acyltransferase family protein [Asticcacaulis sp.]